MKKEIAARMMAKTVCAGSRLSELDAIVSEREKQELVQALGNIMNILTRDFVFRIVRDHPELDPDG